MSRCGVRGEGWRCEREVDSPKGVVCQAHRMQHLRTGRVWRIKGKGSRDREYGRVPKEYDPVPRPSRNTGVPKGEALMTLSEVAEELGVSRQAVWFVERRALAKLRAGLEEWL